MKTITVAQYKRKNELSKTPGGVTVLVEYSPGVVRRYHNIKNPEAYITHIESVNALKGKKVSFWVE